MSSLNSNYAMSDWDNRRQAFNGGINLSYSLRPRLSISSGFHILSQGYQHTTCYWFREEVKNRLVGKLDYLSIPLVVNLHAGKEGRLYFSAGLYGAYNIRAVQQHPEPLGGCDIYYIPDLSERTKDIHFGAILGLGYRILDLDAWQVDLRLRGLRSLGKIDEYRTSHSFLLNIGVNYSLEK